MKIITWNVNGIRACAKKGFVEFMERQKADIFCVQETKAHPEQLGPELLEPLGTKSFFSSAEKKGYSGTATFLSAKGRENLKDVRHGIKIKKFDSEGRFVVTEFKDFTLYNVYFPNGAAREERHIFKQEFLKKFTKHLEKKIKAGEQIIVLGDYNVAHKEMDVHDPKRLSKVSGFLPEERQWFDSFLKIGFNDSFRDFYPDRKDSYTWWSYRENARLANRGWRIDFICVTDGLKDKVKSIEILDDQQGSDHCPIVMEIKC